MIKNIILDIKIIFKTYFKLSNIILFYKISNNNFQKLFLKNIIKYNLVFFLLYFSLFY